MTTPSSAFACDDSVHCITCSDATELLRLVRLSSDGLLGRCADIAGNESEVMLALVPGVQAGEWLLVHAGAALLVSAPPAHAGVATT
jgi:hydrogenase maturation factor